jgi:hypothetical protein
MTAIRAAGGHLLREWVRLIEAPQQSGCRIKRSRRVFRIEPVVGCDRVRSKLDGSCKKLRVVDAPTWKACDRAERGARNQNIVHG